MRTTDPGGAGDGAGGAPEPMPPVPSPRARRERYPVPDEVAEALRTAGLVEAYRARPPYQQNDYIGWITGAKRDATRQKRLRQMLDELRSGERYMGMAYTPRRR